MKLAFVLYASLFDAVKIVKQNFTKQEILYKTQKIIVMEIMTNLNFGMKIKHLIEQKGDTIATAAEKMSYSRQNLTLITKKIDVSTEVLKKVAEVYNLNLSYFLVNQDYNQTSNEFVLAENVAGYKGNNNKIESKNSELENENKLLKAKLEGALKEVELLRKMVDMLNNN